MASTVVDDPRPGVATPGVSRLQVDLAKRILRMLTDRGAEPGYHLIEVELSQHFQVSRTPIRGALKLLAEQGGDRSTCTARLFPA
jgi:DNA-binding GntR family transcriptional regulator